jgi:hypothetical protein
MLEKMLTKDQNKMSSKDLSVPGPGAYQVPDTIAAKSIVKFTEGIM